ncbi:MAG TPA: sigma-70 family RNA polymerase sigma factor [Bacteroidales bacterium]|jgi:RNA polymerase sigma-70 factor (ECF subfamily)|nr:sigma-70 family RNA polymerase sigma factor [Bacteroidales bacterium]MDI9533658.1 sigma-70 family RNA polymerase sigma factor [Bacteroidota bacterium]OPZ58249.1 MAG: ECF RNA polymerase sigma factor SigW [Bacteroidetes bacterium ADurb.BinA012]MBK7732486.1 sigma-70 family RNA polymerase sigma factor [Bacteroidales bacterium]MBP7036559.1 sigma-70 family RNA polymerase sigma factor [Bacteroidales bacterium]
MEVESGLSDKAQYDLKVIDRALHGDSRAYTELLNRYRDSVYYVILRMVNNPSDAEDLTIEAFGKAFHNLAKYVPSHAFSTWLFRIATNNCIDFMRRKSQSPRPFNQEEGEEDEVEATVASDMIAPDELMINRETAASLNRIVKTLKPRYRRLIELRYFEEYSYEEIAKELSLPIGTVKARLFRAKVLILNMVQSKSSGI